jgi:hypothetical protein
VDPAGRVVTAGLWRAVYGTQTPGQLSFTVTEPMGWEQAQTVLRARLSGFSCIECWWCEQRAEAQLQLLLAAPTGQVWKGEVNGKRFEILPSTAFEVPV